MSNVSQCLDKIADDIYQCRVSGRKIRSTLLRVRCACDGKLPVMHEPPCPFAPLMVKLNTTGVTRLQRCRKAESECRHIHKIDGRMGCVAMKGSKCQWVGNWAKCLNGEQAFPNGQPDCPFWETP